MKHITVIFLIVLALGLMSFAPTDASGAVRTNNLSEKVASSASTKTYAGLTRKLNARYARGRQKALDLIMTRSEELCTMIGLDYTPVELNDDARLAVDEDAELSESEMAEASSDDEPEEVAAEQDAVDVDVEGEFNDIEDESSIDMNAFTSMWLEFSDEGPDDLTIAGVEKQRVVDVLMHWLGTRYRFGGTSPRGIDCSAFTRMVYAETAGILLPRTAVEQSTVGSRIDKDEPLEFGDLILFKTARYAAVTHIGIYLGNDLFAHASSRYGVTVSSLKAGYYQSHYLGAVRLHASDVAAMSMNTAPDVH
jgi:cell wall-associated NlpC family hydrolase